MLIIGIVSLNYPTYEMKMWHMVLVFWAIVLLTVLVNTVLGRLFPSIEAMMLIMHIVGFFAILIVLIYLAPKNSADEVFKTWVNGGGWSSQAQSTIIGAVTIMYSFNGVDSALHMAEEIENSTVVIPRAMIITVFINGLTGFALIVALCFCIGPLQAILESEFPFPFIIILLQISGSTVGTSFLVS